MTISHAQQTAATRSDNPDPRLAPASQSTSTGRWNDSSECKRNVRRPVYEGRRRAKHHESHSAATKKCLSFLEINSSQRDAALCSAAVAQSGTDVMVSLIPWPVPEHQRLDARQGPLGASQHAKKTQKTTLHISQYHKDHKKIFPRSLPRPLFMCMMSVQTVHGQ